MGEDKGRPTKYKEEYDELVYKLALLGLTDKEIGSVLDVAESTINNWKHDHPAFLESLKKGKEVADSNVVESLYRRAIGYEHDEDKIFNDNGAPLIVPTKKRYPPDPTSIIYWLNNRQPKRFRKDGMAHEECDNKQETEVNID